MCGLVGSADAVLGGALVLPPVLVVLLVRVAGDGDGWLAVIRPVAVIGPVVDYLCRALVSLYFPAFLAPYRVGPVFALLGLYLLFAVFYLVRRRWVCAGVLLIVPIVCTWILSPMLPVG